MINEFFRYLFHKNKKPLTENTYRWRCQYYHTKQWKCLAAIWTKDNKVLSVGEHEHVCREADATQYHIHQVRFVASSKNNIQCCQLMLFHSSIFYIRGKN